VRATRRWKWCAGNRCFLCVVRPCHADAAEQTTGAAVNHIDHAAHMYNAGRHSSITSVTAYLQVTTEAEFDSAIRSHERESLCQMPPKWPRSVLQSCSLLQLNRCSAA
jgi:hypothetical protein